MKNARAQYRSVIERWNSGDLPRRRVLPGAPEWTGDVAELINRAPHRLGQGKRSAGPVSVRFR